MPLVNGAHFAGSTILHPLGSGGMGEVYLATHPRLPRRDALKILPADVSADPEYRARFRRESDIASTLWHPHIVSVHDRGEYEGQLWLSMDFVDGTDAARLLAERYPTGMPARTVVRIVSAVADALDYAHGQGLLHRDVKPANIMLAGPIDGSSLRVLLMDFGIARRLEDVGGLTATNVAIGTMAYAAPEQLMGVHLDGRADQYALAATAYQLFTGRLLFAHSNPAVVISHHLAAPPPTLAASHRQLARFDAVLAKALAKEPQARYPDCATFARALADCLSALAAEPTVIAPPAVPAEPDVVPRRRRTPWLIAAAVTAVAVTCVGGLAMLERNSARHPAAPVAQPSTTALTPVSTTTGTPPVTTPTPTPTTTPTPAVTDVDPADFAMAEAPGYYRWVYSRTPYYQDCGIFPVAMDSIEPEGLVCSVIFPPDAPEVSNPPFRGPPNEIQIILPDGPAPTIGEGGRPTAKALLPNQRITVGVFSCTALAGGGIDCTAPTGGFTLVDGVLTTHTTG